MLQLVGHAWAEGQAAYGLPDAASIDALRPCAHELADLRPRTGDIGDELRRQPPRGHGVVDRHLLAGELDARGHDGALVSSQTATQAQARSWAAAWLGVDLDVAVPDGPAHHLAPECDVGEVVGVHVGGIVAAGLAMSDRECHDRLPETLPGSSSARRAPQRVVLHVPESGPYHWVVEHDAL